MPKRTELRDYTIQPGRLADFVAAWTAGVLPLRRRFGFSVDGAWTVPAEDRFVWILSYQGPDTFEERNAAYYASQERKATSPDPAQWIAEGRHAWVDPIALD